MQKRTSTIKEIFKNTSYTCLRGANDDMQISNIVFASSEVSSGALFFCVVGLRSDGHDFAASAVAAGAACLVVQRELDLDIPQVLVKDTRATLSLAAANFFGNPSTKMQLAGITGTNGKTTTTFLVEHIARVANKKCGLMGTVEVHIGDEVRPSLRTTPESRDLQELLYEMKSADVEVVALEVSSHAISLGRIAHTHFAVAAFSNLTQDHLDYHKTMDNYFAAKARFFTDFDVEKRVICIDGEYGKKLAKICKDAGHEILTVGACKESDIHIKCAVFSPSTTFLTVEFGKEEIDFELPLVGRFNVENALVASGICIALGFSPKTIVKGLESAPQVAGRMERVRGTRDKQPNFGVLVDYAHTPDALQKAITALAEVTPGQVICVFGCGGDRDKDKRPKMGRAALLADKVIVTSDNPRTEDPLLIIDEILAGMKDDFGATVGAGLDAVTDAAADTAAGVFANIESASTGVFANIANANIAATANTASGNTSERVTVEPDRARAIHKAFELAQDGDAILICGKGHESYQIIGTEKLPFDDRKVAATEIDALC